MPLYRLRQTMTRPEGDVVQWGYGIDGPAISDGILGALIDRMQTAYSTSGVIPLLRGGMKWTLLEAFPAGGGPAAAVRTVAPVFTISSTLEGPGENTIAVSADIVTTRGRSPRGRTFYGPFQSVTDNHIGSVAIGNFGSLALSLHSGFLSEGYTPVVISTRLDGAPRPSPVGLPIVGYSIDNAWDTMRSRGYDATTRTVFDPA